MVAMPPCPRSSMSRYRPPRTLPISAKSLLPSCRVARGRPHRSVPTARADRAGFGVQTLRDALPVTEGTDRGAGPPGVRSPRAGLHLVTLCELAKLAAHLGPGQRDL